MEVIDYEIPDKWDAKGMNWGNPIVERADYAMAIREALMERAAVLHTGVSADVMAISPYKPVSRKALAACVTMIKSIAPSFVNRDFDDYKEDLSDFPKMWTYRELVEEEGCNLYDFAGKYTPCKDGGAWLRAIRKAIDKLTVIKCPGMTGTQVSRSGNKHDPPFDESISTALELAFKNTSTSTYSGTFPVSVYGWSGNTHWCWPRKDDEDSKDGYCGYAESRAISVKSVTNWLLGAEFDLLMAAKCTKPTDPVPYSQVLDMSVFDSGKTGLREGVYFLDPVHVKDAKKVELDIGDPDEIPKNSNVPSSEYDEDGNVIQRHSNKIGYYATIWGLLDYGVKNGFRFQENN